MNTVIKLTDIIILILKRLQVIFLMETATMQGHHQIKSGKPFMILKEKIHKNYNLLGNIL
jgi:hypothetical protein